jgi:hypothetical protein
MSSRILLLSLVGLGVAGAIDYREASTGLSVPRMEAGPTELELGDVNGDGHVDIVSIGDHGSPFINSDEHGIMVWFGDGAGTWSVFQNGNFGYGGVALGDVNGDGLMDVGYAMHHNYSGTDFGNQLIEVALGDGTGRNWTPWDDGLATNGETYGMFGTDFADVDNDGDLDVASVSFGCCAGVHVYLNNSDGTWRQSYGFVGGNSMLYLRFGDFNGDGNADFICGLGSNLGTVYMGDGRGNFAVADGDLPSAGNRGRGSVTVGDVNGDGRDDIAWVNLSGGVSVYSWLSEGRWQNLSGSLPGAGVELVEIADMNLDGYGDLVLLFLGRFEVYAGDGAGNWTLAAAVPANDACDTAALRAGVDVDHNGYPDLAFVAEENCTWWGGGRNVLHAYVETSTPSQPFIHPHRPRGGETFVAGSVRFIDWSAGVPAAAAPGRVDIELSLDGPDGPWQRVADDLPNNGRYQWRVPPETRSTNNAYLRLTLRTDAGDAVAITPRAFRIRGGRIAGDLNGDGCVDQADLATLLADWGCTGGDCAGDVDEDGDTDQADLAVLLANWGMGC